MNRREALRQFLLFAASSPVLAAQSSRSSEPGHTGYPPTYSDEVMGPVNLHEFEEVAKSKIHKLAYDFIAGMYSLSVHPAEAGGVKYSDALFPQKEWTADSLAGSGIR